jgi:predicted nucleic acid-binding protein
LLIETDILLAAMNPNDPLRPHSLKVLDETDLVLSPYSMLEIHLLEKAGKLEIVDFSRFANDVVDLFVLKKIQSLPDKIEYHYWARQLERKHKLTFFDSLHAAVAKVERETLLSFDASYTKLKGEGIKSLDPREL